MNLYMHTINGQPGEFQPLYGTICYAGKACRRFAKSLQQIRREQKAARAADARDIQSNEYGYVLLQLGKTGEPK